MEKAEEEMNEGRLGKEQKREWLHRRERKGKDLRKSDKPKVVAQIGEKKRKIGRKYVQWIGIDTE